MNVFHTLVSHKNEYYGMDVAPREMHEIEDEMLKKERELGNELMLQRD